MKTRTMLRKLSLLIACSCMLTLTSMGQQAPNEFPGRAAIKALILVDDQYAGSQNVEDNQDTIIEKDLLKKKEDFCLKIYPNPIRTSATIDFDMKKSGVAQIVIYDRNGNMVLDVVKQKFEMGHNKVTFTPSSLSTGVYYVYLITKECQAMRKCMII